MNEELKDIRPPDVYPTDHSIWVVIGLVVLLGFFVLLGWWLWQRYRKDPVVDSKIEKTPWEIALEALSQLQDDPCRSQGTADEFFFRLTAIVRHYIEDRFHVNAAEMTTDEFLQYMKTTATLNDRQKEFLKQFLTASDLIKFAKGSSTSEEMKEALGLAQELVQETIPTYEPVTPSKVK